MSEFMVPTNPNLISFSGRMGSGKDLATKILQYLTCDDEEIRTEFLNDPEKAMDFYDGIISFNSQYKNVKFAGKVKLIVAELLGVTVSKLEDKTYINKELSSEWWYYIVDGEKIPFNDKKIREEERENIAEFLVKLTPRKLMQLVGTEAGREIIHPDLWVNSTFTNFKPNEDGVYPRWVISDVRFPNELEKVHQEGGLSVRLVRYRLLSEWLDMYAIELEDMGDYEDLKISDVDFMEFMNELDSRSLEEVSERINHPSETSLDGHKFHFEIDNDGTIADLVNEIYEILVKVGVICPKTANVIV